MRANTGVAGPVIPTTGGSKRRPGFHRGQRRLLFAQQRLRLIQIHAAEAQGIAGAQLPQFPKVGLHHGDGADKTAEAGAVGAEQDGHVAGEVHRAHGIGIVVDVGGV